VNRVIEGGHEPRRFATDMLDRFRDLIVLASVPDAISTGLLDVPPDRAEALRGQAERYGLASLTRAADLVAAGLDQMRGATSPRLLLELMCAQVLLPAAATDELSLLARIERLESGAVTASAGTAGTGVPVPAPQKDHGSEERSRPAPPAPPSPAPRQAQDPGQSPAYQPPAAASGDQPRPAPARPEDQRPAQGGHSQPPASPAAPPAAPAAPVAQRPAAPFTHAPGAPGADAVPTPAPSNGSMSLEQLRQSWPSVVEAVKSKGRVAWMVIGNASVASFDEGVLTLRFPRQGDVKGFQGGKYEDLLKQVINTMYGINVTIRAVTGGGDAASPSRRPGPAPTPAPGPGMPGSSGSASPGSGPSGFGGTPGQSAPASGAPGFGAQPEAGPGGPTVNGAAFDPGQAAPGASLPVAGAAANGGGNGTPPFSGPGVSSGDLPLPPPPAPDDDEDFDPDGEDMASSTTVNELTGMALVQRELGGQVIAEYDD